MIPEVINAIKELKRPEIIKDELGNHYIYSDYNRKYERIPKNAKFERYICNIESFAKVVLSCFSPRRCVIFEEDGATFYTDEDLKNDQDKWIFKRKFTNLWNVISELCYSEPLKHRDLLNNLEAVKNSVIDFENLYQTLSKLKVNKKISFASSPVFEDGEQSGSYEWEQKIDANGSTEKARCPSCIRFKGKIVRGSQSTYEFSVNLVPVIDSEKGMLLFKIFMPTIDLVLDQVREDEQSDFIKLIGDEANKLLILRNY